MPDIQVTQPVKASDAFQQSGDAAALSQAAVLLLAGSQLRGELRALRAGVDQASQPPGVPQEDLDILGIPRLAAVPGLFNPLNVQNDLKTFFGSKLPDLLPGRLLKDLPADILAGLGDRFMKSPSEATATSLVEACLRHPHDLVRVAAAAAHLRRSPDSERLKMVLENGLTSSDELIRELAATALAQAVPEHPGLVRLQSKAPARGTAGASHTTLLVHGTWARQGTWWQPGGDFHTYLTGALPPLPRVPPPAWSAPYAMNDRFEWSGGYSDAARSLAADDLVNWVNLHSAQGLDLFTHSHGGSAAMLATQRGLTVRELVLLSCPVHVPKYLPQFSAVQKVVSIRVHLDLVILVDGGGQRYNVPGIQENVLGVWFDHSATHKPDVWRNQNVTAKL